MEARTLAPVAPQAGEPVVEVRRLEHVATTVPDLDQAVAFFVEALGARLIGRRSVLGEDGDPARFNARTGVTAELATVELGGASIELFHFAGPGAGGSMPLASDPGGHHLGLFVDDVPAAAARLAGLEGVRVLGEPASEEWAGGRRRWVYLRTPWGLQLELADWRPGEAGGGTA